MKFLITSDWHLRIDQPKCRIDNFLETQARKLDWINIFKKKNNIDFILNAGDIFDKARSSQKLERWAIEHMPKVGIISVAGNHDLPYHSLKYYDDCSLAVLESKNSFIQVLNMNNIEKDISFFSSCNVCIHGFSWGRNLDEWIEKEKNIIKNSQNHAKHIALMHIYVYNEKKYWDEDNVALKADSLMKKLSMFDLIITGHNHIPFIKQNGNQILINPGLITRQKADDIYRPRIYIWDSYNGKVTKEYIPIAQNVISTEHIYKKKEEDERLNELVKKFGFRLEKEIGIQSNKHIDFIKEIDDFYIQNDINLKVKEMITECLI